MRGFRPGFTWVARSVAYEGAVTHRHFTRRAGRRVVSLHSVSGFAAFRRAGRLDSENAPFDQRRSFQQFAAGRQAFCTDCRRHIAAALRSDRDAFARACVCCDCDRRYQRLIRIGETGHAKSRLAVATTEWRTRFCPVRQQKPLWFPGGDGAGIDFGSVGSRQSWLPEIRSVSSCRCPFVGHSDHFQFARCHLCFAVSGAVSRHHD